MTIILLYDPGWHFIKSPQHSKHSSDIHVGYLNKSHSKHDAAFLKYHLEPVTCEISLDINFRLDCFIIMYLWKCN